MITKEGRAVSPQAAAPYDTRASGIMRRARLLLRRRVPCLLIAVMLVVMAAAPMGGAQAAENGMIRVALTSMGLPTSVTINISGQYAIPEKPSVNLVSGKSYTLSYAGGQLYINVDGSNVAMGSSFTIKSYLDSKGSGGFISLNNPKYGNRSYMGDMIVRGNEGYVRLINRLYIEDYLYGVVPYEMSNLFPVEALKAQAICARSYAYKRMNGSGVYDLVDTTDAQVYKGYRAAEDVAIRAVNETKGMVLRYQGSVITTYYSASNGGQTEDPNNMWFGSERAPACFVVKDDPYDLRNPLSLTMTTTFNRSGQFLHPAVANALKSKALSQLGSSFNSDPANSQITSLSSFQLTDPRSVATPTRYYTNANVSMRIRAMRNDGYQEERDVSFTISLHDNIRSAMTIEDLRLFTLADDGNTWTLTIGRYGHGAGLSQRGAEQMANEGINYSQILAFYFVGAQIDTLDMTKEPLTQYTGSSSSSSGAAIAQGTVKVSSSLTVRSSRSSSGSSLGSLKNGATVDILDMSGDWYGIAYNGKTGYVSAAYITNVTYLNNTPAQPPADTGSTGGVIMVGTIVLSDTSASVAVRQVKSTLGTQLGVLGNGTRVEIVEYDQGFYGIRYNGYIAYILPDSVRIDEYVAVGATPQPTPQPTPEVITVYATGTVVTESSPSVNMRTGPSADFDLVGILPKGSAVELIGSTAGWYRLRYNGSVIGWVMSTYVQTSGAVPETGYNGVSSSGGATGGTGGSVVTPAPAPTPTPAPRTGKTTKKCDVYSWPDGPDFASLAANTPFREIETRDGWSRVEAKDLLGWVKSENLKYDDGASGTSSSSSASSASTSSATTTTAVKLRAGAGTSYKSFGTVPSKTKITVLSKGSQWTKVEYKGQPGYIMTKYLKF